MFEEIPGFNVMTDHTLIDTLARQVKTQPDAAAYRTGEVMLTFADVDRITNRMANAMTALGVAPGDRVGCLTKHHTECLLMTVAAIKVGAVCMPVNWRLAPAEVQFIVSHGQAKLLMVDAAFLDQFLPGGAALPLPDVKQIVCTDKAAGGLPTLADWYSSHSDRFTAHVADPDDAALQLYSSGTTGLPKGVVLSHRNLLSTCQVVGEGWKMDSSSVVGIPLPTFHVAGMTQLLQTLYMGCQASCYSDFDPGAFIDSIGRHGITHSFLVPGILLFLLESPAAPTGDYRTLKLIAYGGSPISERVLQDAMRIFGCDFMQIYGLTETSGPVTFLYPEDHKGEQMRSAGRVVGGSRLRIVEPVTLEDAPEGEVGEVWIEAIRNFREYWRNPKATAEAFPEGRNANGGWFRSGDGGYIKDGYLFINDRIKDMIISGGENIYPAEIENVLMNHPCVADCAVIGVPDEKWGEAVKACVVRKPGVEGEPAQIIAWMRERMAHYKCPKTVDFMDALPRNPTGKILKRVLREPYWAGVGRGVN